MAYINFLRDKKQDKTDTKNLLASALNSRKNNNINYTGITPTMGGQDNSQDELYQGIGEAASGAYKLGKSLYDSGIFSKGDTNTGSGIWSNATSDYIGGNTGTNYGTFGNAASDYIGGTSSGGSMLSNAIGNEVNSGSGGSGLSNAPWGQIANTGKAMYNNISGKTPEEYSDLEQSTIYPMQGAANGYSLGGPWGALGGALYGLGYSFKDDMGLKDSNFLTQVLYPIGMGDGGGLRFGGESYLDIL